MVKVIGKTIICAMRQKYALELNPSMLYKMLQELWQPSAPWAGKSHPGRRDAEFENGPFSRAMWT
ncbi:hypothetical protein [Desulfosoma caldarium]|uniref:hypothetical protein n=1 Tax=Desulfosoma caldarium TaxID=610254 RepID=UPI000F4635C2|nr:hypothetical protein [Desulfosoma caldarium]